MRGILSDIAPKDMKIHGLFLPRPKIDGKDHNSGCLVEFEVFLYKPVADLLEIPSPAFVLGNKLKNLGEILIHQDSGLPLAPFKPIVSRDAAFFCALPFARIKATVYGPLLLLSFPACMG